MASTPTLWVVDTNVLISAALVRSSQPAALVNHILQAHRLVFSPSTFDELRTRLYRPKFDRYISLEMRERLLHDFNASAHWVEIGTPLYYCRDHDDDQFIATALAAQAPYLISGDKDLLEAPAVANLSILNVAAGLRLLLSA